MVEAGEAASDPNASFPVPCRSALAALGGEFNYHSALAELDILKRSSLLMAGPSGSAASPGREAGLAGASALRAALAAAAGGGEVANGADGTALPPVQHPWDDEVAWHNMDAFAKVRQSVRKWTLQHCA